MSKESASSHYPDGIRSKDNGETPSESAKCPINRFDALTLWLVFVQFYLLFLVDGFIPFISSIIVSQKIAEPVFRQHKWFLSGLEKQIALHIKVNERARQENGASEKGSNEKDKFANEKQLTEAEKKAASELELHDSRLQDDDNSTKADAAEAKTASFALSFTATEDLPFCTWINIETFDFFTQKSTDSHGAIISDDLDTRSGENAELMLILLDILERSGLEYSPVYSSLMGALRGGQLLPHEVDLDAHVYLTWDWPAPQNAYDWIDFDKKIVGRHMELVRKRLKSNQNSDYLREEYTRIPESEWANLTTENGLTVSVDQLIERGGNSEFLVLKRSIKEPVLSEAIASVRDRTALDALGRLVAMLDKNNTRNSASPTSKPKPWIFRRKKIYREQLNDKQTKLAKDENVDTGPVNGLYNQEKKLDFDTFYGRTLQDIQTGLFHGVTRYEPGTHGRWRVEDLWSRILQHTVDIIFGSDYKAGEVTGPDRGDMHHYLTNYWDLLSGNDVRFEAPATASPSAPRDTATNLQEKEALNVIESASSSEQTRTAAEDPAQKKPTRDDANKKKTTGLPLSTNININSYGRDDLNEPMCAYQVWGEKIPATPAVKDFTYSLPPSHRWTPASYEDFKKTRAKRWKMRIAAPVRRRRLGERRRRLIETFGRGPRGGRLPETFGNQLTRRLTEPGADSASNSVTNSHSKRHSMLDGYRIDRKTQELEKGSAYMMVKPTANNAQFGSFDRLSNTDLGTTYWRNAYKKAHTRGEAQPNHGNGGDAQSRHNVDALDSRSEQAHRIFSTGNRNSMANAMAEWLATSTKKKNESQSPNDAGVANLGVPRPKRSIKEIKEQSRERSKQHSVENHSRLEMVRQRGERAELLDNFLGLSRNPNPRPVYKLYMFSLSLHNAFDGYFTKSVPVDVNDENHRSLLEKVKQSGMVMAREAYADESGVKYDRPKKRIVHSFRQLMQNPYVLDVGYGGRVPIKPCKALIGYYREETDSQGKTKKTLVYRPYRSHEGAHQHLYFWYSYDYLCPRATKGQKAEPMASSMILTDQEIEIRKDFLKKAARVSPELYETALRRLFGDPKLCRTRDLTNG